MTIHPDDIRLIKSMGFGLVKLLVNPAVIQSKDGLDAVRMGHFDQIVDLAASENLPAVVCIHPEDEFKRAVTGNAGRFEDFLGLIQAMSRHIAKCWPPRPPSRSVSFGRHDNDRDTAHAPIGACTVACVHIPVESDDR